MGQLRCVAGHARPDQSAAERRGCLAVNAGRHGAHSGRVQRAGGHEGLDEQVVAGPAAAGGELLRPEPLAQPPDVHRGGGADPGGQQLHGRLHGAIVVINSVKSNFYIGWDG